MKPIILSLLVFIPLCLAKITYVDNLTEFETLYNNLPEPAQDKFSAVFLQAFLSTKQIISFPERFPYVMHYQWIEGFFYAIYFKPSDISNISSAEGNSHSSFPAKQDSPGISQNSPFKNPKFIRPYSIIDYHNFETYYAATCQNAQSYNDVDEATFVACIVSSQSCNFPFVKNREEKQFILDVYEKYLTEEYTKIRQIGCQLNFGNYVFQCWLGSAQKEIIDHIESTEIACSVASFGRRGPASARFNPDIDVLIKLFSEGKMIGQLKFKCLGIFNFFVNDKIVLKKFASDDDVFSMLYLIDYLLLRYNPIKLDPAEWLIRAQLASSEKRRSEFINPHILARKSLEDAIMNLETNQMAFFGKIYSLLDDSDDDFKEAKQEFLAFTRSLITVIYQTRTNTICGRRHLELDNDIKNKIKAIFDNATNFFNWDGDFMNLYAHEEKYHPLRNYFLLMCRALNGFYDNVVVLVNKSQ